MKVTALLVGFLMGFTLCVGVAQADVLYNTLPGYDNSAGATISGTGAATQTYLSYAQPFTVAGGNFTLSSVEVAASWAGYPLRNASTVSLSLLADNTGTPGSEIESLGTMSTAYPASVIQFNSSSHPLLESGQTYWVAMLPGASNTWASWCVVGSHTPGLGAIDEGSGWATSTNDGICAMKVNAVSAVPEPGTLLALCSGILGLAGFAARHRK